MRAEGCGRTLGSAVRAGESGGCFAHEIGLGEELRNSVRRLRTDRQPAEHTRTHKALAAGLGAAIGR